MAGKDEGMHFVRVVPVYEPGVIEFKAWENARWLGIWEKPWNNKSTNAHLVFEDCPGGRQITYRMLILEGQTSIPLDEKWLPLSLWFNTRKSFATIWMNAAARKKTGEPERGEAKAKEVVADKLVGVEDLENAVVYAK